MHVNADMKSGVSVASNQGVYFNQQQANQQANNNTNGNNNPNNGQPNQTTNQSPFGDSCTVSQSQNINFSQQQQQSSLRAQRPPQNQNAKMGPNMGAQQQNQQPPPSQQQQQQQQFNANQMQGNTINQMGQMSQNQHMTMNTGPGMMQNQMGMNNGMMGQQQQMGGGVSNNNNNNAMTANMGIGSGNMAQANMNNMGIRHDQIKFMQQQQFMRSQAAMFSNRPPPPDYKATPNAMQMMQNQQQLMHQNRFPPNMSNMRRQPAQQQQIPPTGKMSLLIHMCDVIIAIFSGPVMRGHNPSMFMQHGGPRQMNAGTFQRPPNMQVVPDAMTMGTQQEWRQVMMQQQQSMSFNSAPNQRQNFNPQGKRQNKFSDLSVPQFVRVSPIFSLGTRFWIQDIPFDAKQLLLTSSFLYYRWIRHANTKQSRKYEWHESRTAATTNAISEPGANRTNG